MPSTENTDDPAHRPTAGPTAGPTAATNDGPAEGHRPGWRAATTAPWASATLRAAATLRARAGRRPRGRRPPEDRLLVATLLVAAAAVVAAGSAGIVSGSCGRGCDEEPAVPSLRVAAALPAPTPSPGRPTPAATRVSARALAARIAEAAHAQGTVSMTLTGSGARTLVGEGVVRYPGAPGAGDVGDADLSVRLQVGDERLRTVLAGPDLFFAPPRPLAGRAWIRTSRGAAGPLRSEWSDAVTCLVHSARPWRAAGEAVEVTEAGTLRVDGRVLTRYLVRPSVARSTGGAAAPAGGTCEPLHALLGAAGPAQVEEELLVDTGGLPRRLVTTVRGARGTSVTTVEYRSWGVRVRIPLPPPSQVVEAETTRT